MRTNELKKGTRVLLRNGWEAELMDNMRGNARLARVYGDYTEIGSIYSHNIVAFKQDGNWNDNIELTQAQHKLMAFIKGATL